MVSFGTGGIEPLGLSDVELVTRVRVEFYKQHLTWLTNGWELDIVADVIEQPWCVVVIVICLLKCWWVSLWQLFTQVACDQRLEHMLICGFSNTLICEYFVAHLTYSPQTLTKTYSFKRICYSYLAL